MATLGETSRPAYVYDVDTDTWIPVGIGPHSHDPSAINAVASTTFDAKGDLLGGTGADTYNKLTVGNNGDTLLADSTQTTGLRWGNNLGFSAGKNALINGAFNVWQRGTSGAGATSATTGFVADRWQGFRSGYASGMTMSRQTTSDTTNLPFIQYCIRVQRDSGNTGTGTILLSNCFESSASIPFAGRTVTVSFYARCGSNFSQSTSSLQLRLQGGTGTDQSVPVGFTGSNNIITSSATLTTTWQRFSATATVGSDRTQLAVILEYNPSGTAGAADYFEVTGVQLEAGSVATTFQTATGTIQGELAACQRYYFRQNAGSGFTQYAQGFATSTTVYRAQFQLPVTMRVVPTAVEFASLEISDLSTGYSSGTFAIDTNLSSNSLASIQYTHGTGALTQFRPMVLKTTASSGYLGVTAEL